MLALDSDYLRNLEDFRILAPQAVTTTVGSLRDLVVYPIETCHLRGGRQVTLDTTSHLGLLTQRRVLSEVERALRSATEPAG